MLVAVIAMSVSPGEARARAEAPVMYRLSPRRNSSHLNTTGYRFHREFRVLLRVFGSACGWSLCKGGQGRGLAPGRGARLGTGAAPRPDAHTLRSSTRRYDE